MDIYIGKLRREHYYKKNIGLFLHRDHKIVENHAIQTTKTVLPVSNLWGWQLEVQNHKLRHKEVLNHSHFIYKRVQGLQAFGEKPFSEELMSITDFTLSVNFAEIPGWDGLLWHLHILLPSNKKPMWSQPSSKKPWPPWCHRS